MSKSRAKRVLTLAVLLSIHIACRAALAAVPGANPGDLGVREVEDGWSRAFVTGDAAYLEALLDPAYVSVNTQGVARPKADIIALASAYAKAHPGSSATPLPPTSTIDVKGTAALVVHHGKDGISVDVFHYTSGHWIAWYSQHTAIAPTPPK